MFKQNTVLVLGAGASIGYKYPLGEEFVELIVDYYSQYNSKSNFIDSIRNAFYSDCEPEAGFDRLDELVLNFWPQSIDSFLSNNIPNLPGLAYPAKVAMANILLSIENKGKLSLELRRSFEERMSEERWYQVLFNDILSGHTPKSLLSGGLNVKIITFNYDVSLDYFLYSRVMQTGFFSDSEKSEFLRLLSDSIFHVYGEIRKFKWQGGDEDNDSYGDVDRQYNTHSVDLARRHMALDRCKNIKIIGEERGGLRGIDTAKKWLFNADKVVFLGFGFAQENVDLLELKQTCLHAKSICLTNYGNSQRVSEIVKNNFAIWKLRGDKSGVMPREDTLRESYKSVFQAITQDFSIN